MNTDLKPLKEAVQRALATAELTEQSVDQEYEALSEVRYHLLTPEQRVERRTRRNAWFLADGILQLLRDAQDLMKDLEEVKQ